jgi:hypothetical protein
MMVYTLRALNLDHAKVNVNGGAIALGHPIDKPILFMHFAVYIANNVDLNTLFGSSTDSDRTARVETSTWEGAYVHFISVRRADHTCYNRFWLHLCVRPAGWEQLRSSSRRVNSSYSRYD